MRIRLKRGKQKELILLAKGNLNWGEFSRILNFPKDYLSHDIKNENILISEELYNKICAIAKCNYDYFIEERLDDNWGKSKGGKKSIGSLIKLPEVKFDEKLAEFVGAVLGDGHVCFYKKGKKIGVYSIKIAGDLEKDRDYHINYLKLLCKKIFNLKAREIRRKEHNERFLDISSKELVNFFHSMGIKAGNKIANQSTIPRWIFKNKKFIRACIRGLIDTDGSIFRMSNKDPKLLRISFTNHNFSLLRDSREAFIQLGFNPSNLIGNKRFYLSRKSNIEKYLREVGFSNSKHIKRLQEFKYSPVV